jgi:arylsulfatase
VLDQIPDDRITDGIDQTAFLLNGEGHSRRDYMVHYSGPKVGALRLGDYKAVMGSGGGGGLPSFEFYNVVRDPGERYGKMYPYLWFIQPVSDLMQKHMQLIEKYPHNTYAQ